MTDEFKKKLSKHLKPMTSIPFLFVGSGFSRRYFNLPNWNDLLMQVCQRLKLTRDYSYYFANTNGDLQKVATMMSKDLNDIWWIDERFKESVKECKEKNYIIGTASPLKYEICKYIREISGELKDEYKDEVEAFKKINVGSIITTNWDNNLEFLFPDFKAYIGQEELLFYDKVAVGDIFKIHGGIEDPNSLILTHEDYEGYNKKNAYLASKLLTMFVEQPIIFLGYRLGDSNIEEILKSIVACLTNKNVGKLKDRLLFCEWIPGLQKPTFEEGSKVLSDSTLSIKILKMDSYIPLYEVLAENKERMPIQVLRKIQNMVYEVVKSKDSRGKVFATDDLKNIADSQEIELVFGFNLKNKLSQLGYKAILRSDLFEDVLEDKGWDAISIATEVLPRISKNNTYVPYFKYLRTAGLIDENNNLKIDDYVFSESFRKKVQEVNLEFFQTTADHYQNRKESYNYKYNSIAEVVRDIPMHIAYQRFFIIPLLDMEKLIVSDLEVFIREHKEYFKSKAINKSYESNFFKIICLFDYLKFKLEL